MKRLFACAVVMAASFLGACSANVSVSAPQISPTDFASQSKTPGRYAVWLQSGAWVSTVEAKGHTCSAWTFPTDFEQAYQQAAQAAFASSFQEVTFTPKTLQPAEIEAQNFDAQIIVYEGSIKGVFGVIPGFWTGTLESEVGMDGIVAVVGPEGLQSQGRAKGRGYGTKEAVMGCDAAAEAIMKAGSAAIKDFVVDAVNAAKLNVMEVKMKTQAPAGTPSS
ncbi:hypothetical protein [Parvibaculum sp.]|uniref:hypothetical protein n=1 Tax=Parvibaculum sp. TaxID=2024848 RepID=UPI00391B1DED